MPTSRLRSLTIKGFRAFGAPAQTLNLPSDIAAVWAPNSKGKTSLAEAIEFLLTGRIVRRELMASSQDEFADALRNAHLAPGEDVYVAARIDDGTGAVHEVKRILTTDYGKRQDCQSRLEIDGIAAPAGGVAAVGIALSQPPFEAPVLAQHTLSHIFSIGPQDRATYFKTLLEVTDLDQFRNDVANLGPEAKPPLDPLVTKFDACCAMPALEAALADAAFMTPDAAGLEASLGNAAAALISGAGAEVPDTLSGRIAKLEAILAERRSKAFPVEEFRRSESGAWTAPADQTWIRLARYIDERAKINAETRRLAALFGEALKIPAIATIAAPIDCPLCDTQAGLTPERVEVIRRHVESTNDFKTAIADAREALTQLSVSAGALSGAAAAGMPQWLKATIGKRRAAGFTIARIRAILGEQPQDFVTPWLAQIRPLARAGRALQRAAGQARALANRYAAEIETAAGFDDLKSAFAALNAQRTTFADAINAYKGPAAILENAINSVLDAQADTAGWRDFLEIAKQPAALRASLLDRQARAVVGKEIEAALAQIDRAKENVLNDKFSEYSASILSWWERLRPEESTFFAAVQPRKGTRRTIDFKAGLSPDAGRASAKVRDVIAVFSQSQLHCLGLALFLARAEREGMGFIVLDDPVLSSDEDYRVHFNTTVLDELLKLPMQVLVLTQDHDTWEELEVRYRHVGIATAQMFIDNPAQGSLIENTSDALAAKISRAKSLARGGHPDSRKSSGLHLRDGGERFCKEMLVNDRKNKGEAAASLTDYDDKSLEWLCPRVQPLLVNDSSHSGRLEAFKDTVNKACHDNVPPPSSSMVHACGEIAFLVKEYLGR
ncbi:MAG: AAA family ATPase [Candidatus Hydrogenedentes bacterium]|nr:AAA family ATPase [Candidatus Hydrogenedentota bacterium]